MKRTILCVSTPVDITIVKLTHTADLIPSFESTKPIPDAQIAVIASCLALSVLAVLGVWYLRLQRSGVPRPSGLITEDFVREVPSLRRELWRKYQWGSWAWWWKRRWIWRTRSLESGRESFPKSFS